MRHQLLPIALVVLMVDPRAVSAQHDMLRERGRLAMGFDQDRTTHHFILRPDGGIISVEVNQVGDDTNRLAIRAHLHHIALDFAAGRFDAPFQTHGEEPPGTTTMCQLRAAIRYTAEDTDRGARITIRSGDPVAVAAVHDFLIYQIREHRTGDPTQEIR
jgi:hypothetical protein